MAIQGLYDSLTPLGFYSLVVGIAFLLGLFLGWCLWWWKSRQFQQTQELSKAAAAEVDELSEANRELSARVQQSEYLSERQRTESNGQKVVLGSGGSVAWMPLDDSAALEPLAFVDNSDPDADWSEVDGVDGKLSAELALLGVRNERQVRSLKPEQRRLFDAKLARKGLTWPWGDSDSGHLVSGSGLAGTGLAGAGIAGAGIAVAAAVGLSGSKQDPNDEQQLADGDSAAIAAMLHLSDVRGQEVDWSNVDGIQPGLAKELQRLGIKNPSHVDSLSDEQRQTLDATLAAKGLNWDHSVASAAMPGSLGSASSEFAKQGKSGDSWYAHSFLSSQNQLAPPPHAASVTLAKEANAFDVAKKNPSGEEHLHLLDDEGHQLVASLSLPAAQTSSTTSHSGGAKISGFSSGTGLSASDGYTTQRLSDSGDDDPNQIPVFSTGVPRVKDDLTLLDGINAIEAEELHRMGIHNFDQLHDLSDDDRHRLKAWFRRRGWYLDMDQWRIASEGNTLNPTLEDIQKKAYEVYQHRDHAGRHGAENTDWEQAEWSLRGNPIFDYGVPHHVDYFVETVDGITPAACDELYRMGLYNSQEIQALDLDSRRLLTRWFAGPRFKVDLTSAFGWLSSLETVPQDKDYGFVFTQRPDQIDDLSDVNGVGPATERDLNRIGIYHFNQIAHWSDANVQAIRDTLNLGDRIEKDMWVVQAQRLSGQSI